jgi:hypothetical protein
MGVLLSNARRRVSVTIAGKTIHSLEKASVISEGTLLQIVEGREEGSKNGGIPYVVAKVQVKPGTDIRVAGYGEEQIAAIRAVSSEPGKFTAYLSGMGRGGYKLTEFVPEEAQSAVQTAA